MATIELQYEVERLNYTSPGPTTTKTRSPANKSSHLALSTHMNRRHNTHDAYSNQSHTLYNKTHHQFPQIQRRAHYALTSPHTNTNVIAQRTNPPTNRTKYTTKSTVNHPKIQRRVHRSYTHRSNHHYSDTPKYRLQPSNGEHKQTSPRTATHAGQRQQNTLR
jgi:hypothetical protein